NSLDCYICAHEGLGENEECRDSVPYSCNGYARRWSEDERMFCRTTRHQGFNGTFTIIKECIAETAHYSTFEQKLHPLEEDCDVQKVNDIEVVFCICNTPLCNNPSITEQFEVFEENNPHLFERPNIVPNIDEPSDQTKEAIEQEEEERKEKERKEKEEEELINNNQKQKTEEIQKNKIPKRRRRRRRRRTKTIKRNK
ncbi:hypothetical protein Mgra_00004627, partial [Meloidogyne graminicola]